jgi:hypothetical protein
MTLLIVALLVLTDVLLVIKLVAVARIWKRMNRYDEHFQLLLLRSELALMVKPDAH